MHRFSLIAIMAAFLFVVPQAKALDAYTGEQSAQFMDWCTGKAGNTETACTCTLKRLATTMPPAALATFLTDKSGGGGFSMSSASITGAALVTDALTQCLK